MTRIGQVRHPVGSSWLRSCTQHRHPSLQGRLQFQAQIVSRISQGNYPESCLIEAACSPGSSRLDFRPEEVQWKVCGGRYVVFSDSVPRLAGALAQNSLVSA
eukprot:767423-Hanusia_phi.AAC.2